MYKKEKSRTISMLTLSTLVFLLAAFYLFFGRHFAIYDWKFGLLSVGIGFFAFSVFSVYFKDYYALFMAPRCPRCEGLLEVSEVSLRETTVFENLTLAPIIDRISKCTLCGSEHHYIYAKPGGAGSVSPIGISDSFQQRIHNRFSAMQIRRPAMTDEEISHFFAALDAQPRERATTPEEWRELLSALQHEAHIKNVEAGMIFPKDAA